jgi:hypothetical protein
MCEYTHVCVQDCVGLYVFLVIFFFSFSTVLTQSVTKFTDSSSGLNGSKYT